MRRLFLLLGLTSILSACGGETAAVTPSVVNTPIINTPTLPLSTVTATPIPASATPDIMTPEKMIAAFKAAGLEAEDPEPLSRDEDPSGAYDGSAIHFFIPSLCVDCGGRVFSIEDKGKRERLRNYYENLGKDPALSSWVYVNPPILVQINGDLPERYARQYEAVVMGKPVPTYIPVTTTPEPTPEPIILSGTGQTVTDPIDFPPGISLLVFEHTGRRNFIVKAFTDDSEELLVNEVGNYSGRRPLAGKKGVFFEIKADGPWSIHVGELPLEPNARDGISGRGDWVSGYFLPKEEGRKPVDFTHDGERNFIVYLYCKGGAELAQNEIGVTEGASVVDFNEGPCFWDIQADGYWSIKPR